VYYEEKQKERGRRGELGRGGGGGKGETIGGGLRGEEHGIECEKRRRRGKMSLNGEVYSGG